MEKLLCKRKLDQGDFSNIIKIKKKKTHEYPDTIILQNGIAQDAISKLASSIKEISTDQPTHHANSTLHIYTRIKDPAQKRKLEDADQNKNNQLFQLTPYRVKAQRFNLLPPIPTISQQTQIFISRKREEDIKNRRKIIQKKREKSIAQKDPTYAEELLYCNEKPVSIENYNEMVHNMEYEYYSLAFEDEHTNENLHLHNMYEDDEDSQKSIDYPSSDSSDGS